MMKHYSRVDLIEKIGIAKEAHVAKRAARGIKISDDWEEAKLTIMTFSIPH